MSLFNLEHSHTAYRVDFALYGTSIIALAPYLVWSNPSGDRLALLAWGLIGVVSWTLIEYVLHRFVLHGLQPSMRWHAAHHERPTALICSFDTSETTMTKLSSNDRAAIPITKFAFPAQSEEPLENVSHVVMPLRASTRLKPSAMLLG